MIAAATAVAKPYPGLRPFDIEESEVFFGREAQTDELLRRLARQRFVAVVGTSGSGKSSLVRAGLLPALLGGQLTSAGSHWRIAVLRPGGDPTESLAFALHTALNPGNEHDQFARDMLDITLRRSSLGLIEAVRQARLAAHENLLVVVDQFEELFRFKQASSAAGDEAAAFVHLILEAARQKELPVHVLITMRSDFLGDCAQYRDLSQAINDGLYLIPRMTRDELRLAITGPGAVYGVRMTPRLVQELLNDVNDDPDQLPVLQHALMRTWYRWCNTTGNANTIDLDVYGATGGMAEALSRHANEVFSELADDPALPNKHTARRLFQCLTEKGPDNREIRRPTRFADLCRILDTDPAIIRGIIERFREEDRAFLMPPRQYTLRENSVVDISHESLIRKWDLLRGWVEEEANSVEMYRRIAEAARLNESGQAGLWGNPQLQLALDWRAGSRPTAAWAERYALGFESAMTFLDRSVERHEQEIRREQEERRRDAETAKLKRTHKRIFVLMFAVAVVAGIFVWQNLKIRRLLAETIARRLSTQAALLNTQTDAALAQSVLLAAESMVRGPSVQGDEVLRLGLSLLPKQTARIPHGGEVNDIAWSPDGRYMATASADGTARLIDAAAGRELWSMKHTAGVNAVNFSRYHGYLATATADGTATVFSVPDGRKVMTASSLGSRSADIAFRPDGRFVAVATINGAVKVIDVTRGAAAVKTIRVCETSNHPDAKPGECEVNRVVYDWAGGRIVAGSDDGSVRVLDATSGKELWRAVETFGTRKALVYDVAVSEDGNLIAAAIGYADVKGALGKVRVFNASNGQEVFRALHQRRVTAVALSPKERLIASASFDNTVRVFHVDTAMELWRHVHQDSVRSVTFSPDGRLLATGSADSTARVFEVRTGKEIARLPHDSIVNWLAFSPDGKQIATASADKSARLMASSGNSEVRELVGQDFYTAAFSPDHRFVATADEHGRVRVTDLRNSGDLPVLEHEKKVNVIAFSPDARYVATGSRDGFMRYFDVAAGRELWKVSHHGDVYSAVFSGDGQLILTGGEDKNVRLIDAATGRVVSILPQPARVFSAALNRTGEMIAIGSDDKTLRVIDRKGAELLSPVPHDSEVNAVSFSENGGHIVTATGNMVRVINASTGREISRRTYAEWINAVAISPDGRRVAVGGDSGMMRVMDGATGQELSATTHDDKVLALAFTQDSRYLRVISSHAVYRDVLDPAELIKEACSRLSRNLTETEWKRYVPEAETHATCPDLPRP